MVCAQRNVEIKSFFFFPMPYRQMIEWSHFGGHARKAMLCVLFPRKSVFVETMQRSLTLLSLSLSLCSSSNYFELLQPLLTDVLLHSASPELRICHFNIYILFYIFSYRPRSNVFISSPARNPKPFESNLLHQFPVATRCPSAPSTRALAHCR